MWRIIKLLLYLILWELQVSLTSSEATTYLLMQNDSSSFPWDKDPCFENRWCYFLCQAFCTPLFIKSAREDHKTSSQIIQVSHDVCTVHAEPLFTLRTFYVVKEWNRHMTENQDLCNFSSSWFVFNSVSLLILDSFLFISYLEDHFNCFIMPPIQMRLVSKAGGGEALLLWLHVLLVSPLNPSCDLGT